MGRVAFFLLYDAVLIAGLFLYFAVIATVIQWPEKLIRWIIRKSSASKTAPPSEPPRHHGYFDDPV